MMTTVNSALQRHTVMTPSVANVIPVQQDISARLVPEDLETTLVQKEPTALLSLVCHKRVLLVLLAMLP